MELKDFVKGTISSIIEAVEELQAELSARQSKAIVAPIVEAPRGVASPSGVVFPHGSVLGSHPPQSVTPVSFDVAITVGKEGRIEAMGAVSSLNSLMAVLAPL